jgi:hypothetical protein
VVVSTAQKGMHVSKSVPIVRCGETLAGPTILDLLQKSELGGPITRPSIFGLTSHQRYWDVPCLGRWISICRNPITRYPIAGFAEYSCSKTS